MGAGTTRAERFRPRVRTVTEYPETREARCARCHHLPVWHVYGHGCYYPLEVVYLEAHGLYLSVLDGCLEFEE